MFELQKAINNYTVAAYKERYDFETTCDMTVSKRIVLRYSDELLPIRPRASFSKIHRCLLRTGCQGRSSINSSSSLH